MTGRTVHANRSRGATRPSSAWTTPAVVYSDASAATGSPHSPTAALRTELRRHTIRIQVVTAECLRGLRTDGRQPERAQGTQITAGLAQTPQQGMDTVGTGEHEPVILTQAGQRLIDQRPVGRLTNL